MAAWDTLPPFSVPGAIPIRRRSGLSPEQTHIEHVVAGGEGLPCVVTDATVGWRARELWSFEFFSREYGDDQLIANDKAPLRRGESTPMQTVRLPLREYVKYLTVRDHWLSQREHGTPFYGNSWTPFLTHEAMRDHVGRMSFVEDLVEEDGPLGVLSRKLTKVFFGPPATVTRLHHDTYSLHAWLSQVRGRKQFVLYPKSQAHLLHAGEGECAGECAGEGAGAGEGTCCDAAQSWFDPTAPDYRRFPRARRATPHVAVLEEGDTLFCPAGWFHYAIALSPSITLMRNFFNSANADRFVEGWNAAHSLQTQPQPQPQPRSQTETQSVPTYATPPRPSPAALEKGGHRREGQAAHHQRRGACSRQQWRYGRCRGGGTSHNPSCESSLGL